jgi:hypothetical protein
MTLALFCCALIRSLLLAVRTPSLTVGLLPRSPSQRSVRPAPVCLR